jgi:hypothetical protein
MESFDVGNNVLINNPLKGLTRGVITAKRDSTYNVFSGKQRLIGIPERNIKRNISAKKTRESLGGLAGNAAYNLLACPTGGTYIDDNFDISYRLLEIFKIKTLTVLPVSDIKQPFDLTVEADGEVWDCVGVYTRIKRGINAGSHAIAYLKIGGVWFDADNETGLLSKLGLEPSSNMVYRSKEGKLATIEDALLYYKKNSLTIDSRNPNDWEGVATYGQHGKTCGPDAVQSILMYADGFYDTLNRGLYQSLKHKIDERFSYKSILANPYSRDELEAEKTKLIDVLGFKVEPFDIVSSKNGSLIERLSAEDVSKALEFFIYMIIRFYSIDTIPKRKLGGAKRSETKRNRRKHTIRTRRGL